MLCTRTSTSYVFIFFCDISLGYNMIDMNISWWWFSLVNVQLGCALFLHMLISPLAVNSICQLSFSVAPLHLSQSDFATPVKQPSCCCQLLKRLLSWLFFSCHFSAVNHLRPSTSCVHQSSWWTQEVEAEAEILLSLTPSSFFSWRYTRKNFHMSLKSLSGSLAVFKGWKKTQWDLNNKHCQYASSAVFSYASDMVPIFSGPHTPEVNPEARNFFDICARWAIPLDWIGAILESGIQIYNTSMVESHRAASMAVGHVSLVIMLSIK